MLTEREELEIEAEKDQFLKTMEEFLAERLSTFEKATVYNTRREALRRAILEMTSVFPSLAEIACDIEECSLQKSLTETNMGSN